MEILVILLLLLGLSETSPSAKADPVAAMITVGADHPGARISPTMWGVFFEDINFGADGGLSAELVKNRSFEFPDPLMGWTKLELPEHPDSVSIAQERPFADSNPHYLRVKAAAGYAPGVWNEGFRGIGVRAGTSYRFSSVGRAVGADAPVLKVALVGAGGTILAEEKLKFSGAAWSPGALTLRPTATESHARLRLTLESAGTLDLDLVSLLPNDTWKGHGLRADLVQLLADLKPGFMRFPGGCIVEGHYLDGRYQWKNTIGKPENRHLLINRWNDEFKHRPAPDYFQSFDLGFFEFFQLCEDMGAQPLPILNCGMACQFNSGELVPLDQLEPYVQDALDLIEFANGSASTPWGQKRAQLGHPAPFGMKLLGVGNEQWGPQYIERYTRFARALKSSHPEIQLISSAGPGPADDKFAFAWPKLRELKADIIDEHCYDRPDWFLNNTTRYDQYDRRGPKVFMGEYAAQSVKTVSPDNRNNWECALAEAAFMIGLERNADVVVMASYAPLLAHVEAWQWTPDLIWFDNLRAYGTPNYYVQQLFSRNRGDALLPTRVTGGPVAEKGQPRFYASTAREDGSGDVILKVVNASSAPATVQIQITGLGDAKRQATATILTGSGMDAENSLEAPLRVAPQPKNLGELSSTFDQVFPAASMTVLRMKTK